MRFTYDNSAANPRNPNRPPKRVTFGQTSSSEMGSVWLQVLPSTPGDLLFHIPHRYEDASTVAPIVRALPFMFRSSS